MRPRVSVAGGPRRGPGTAPTLLVTNGPTLGGFLERNDSACEKCHTHRKRLAHRSGVAFRLNSGPP